MKSYGQSTTYSDSLKTVTEFVKNAPAILDSLTELKYSRKREKMYLQDIQNCIQYRESIKEQFDLTIAEFKTVESNWNQIKDHYRVKKNGKVKKKLTVGKDIAKVAIGVFITLIII